MKQGGFCYISAIVKNEFREIIVCASDISPQYLYKKSIPLANYLFDIIPNYYVAADAENLPFEDKSVDVIWTHNSLHHFGNVKKFFEESSRVLKDSGVFVALDTAQPYFNRRRYLKAKQARANRFGIYENFCTIFDWTTVSKFSLFRLEYIPGKRIKGKTMRFILNSIFPVGIVFSNIKLSSK